MRPRNDLLLRQVSHAFETLATLDLPPLLALLTHTHHVRQAQLVRQLLLLEWRSRDVLKEFAEFYCVRLLLDHQSPLASYFIDFFCQLPRMLSELHGIYDHLRQPRPLSVDQLRRSIWPAIQTCRLLYAAYTMLPRSRTSQCLDEQRSKLNGLGTYQFKREGRHGRRFLCNELHCRIRGFGFVNLDRQGPSMVSLSGQLGQGGFATVYRGDFQARNENDRTINIGDPVAVKMFANGKSNSTKFGSRLWQSMEHITQQHEQSTTRNDGIIEEDRFSLELGRLVSVRHPNIVTPRGYIGKRPQGESGLVMELMDESLHDYLEKVNKGGVPPLQELDMVDLMLEIAKGMRFLHECNLIHRDLKPKNVLLRLRRDHKDQGCKFSEVKIADFGLTKLCDFAQDASTMYMQTAFQGTSCYMAPELRGDAPSQESPDQMEKVDVFSFGTTCFNILVGNPHALAFSSQSVKGFYEAVKTGEWKQWVQGIDRRLQYIVKLIARCWESEVAYRPTFAVLCVLLHHAMHFLVVSARFRDGIFYAARDFNIFNRFQKDLNLQVYKSIIMNCLDGAVGGVKAITNCFLDFKSIILEKPPPTRTHGIQSLEKPPPTPTHGIQSLVARSILSGIICGKGSMDGCAGSVMDFARLSIFLEAMRNVLDTSDFARDVSLFLEKGQLKAVEHAKYPPVLYLCEFMDNCLDNLDPIIFIKGLACCNLALKYDKILKAKSSLSSIYKMYGFDFKSDEAFCELEVDTSLIPLLVTFCSKSFF